MPRSLDIARQCGSGGAPWIAEQEKLQRQWPALEAALKQPPEDELGAEERGRLVGALLKNGGDSFVDAVRALPAETRRDGTLWLQKIVEQTVKLGHS